MMSGVDTEELPEPQGPLGRLFRNLVTGAVVLIVLGVPLATWIGQRFFGWQPPPFLAKILSLLNS